MSASSAPREGLRQRLEIELADTTVAAEVAQALPDEVLDGLWRRTGGDFASSPMLGYVVPRTSPDNVDSLWVFSFGHRMRSPAAPVPRGEAPAMNAVEPGPTNATLAALTAAFVRQHGVPVVAQWEVARSLVGLGVRDVIAVEPDHRSDGSVVYLSTSGVIDKGLRLLSAAGGVVGRAAVIGHADHAPRCVMTATAVGVDAAVPDGVALPLAYDAQSAQPWTRSRDAYVLADLRARLALG